MSRFEENLELLRYTSAPLADRMEEYHAQYGEPLEMEGFAVQPARSGILTARYANGEEGFSLHSPYDPQREAEQYAERAIAESGEGNFNVMFGLGLGYGVQEVLKRLPPEDRALVFEPHWQLFYLAFCHSDLSTLLSRPQTTFTCDPSIQGAMLSYMNLFELAAFQGVRFFSNPAFERLPHARHFDELAQRIRYEMTAVGGNVQTLMVMGEMQQMNIVLNFPHILDNPPFAHLIGKFAGCPAVIVSAGPSLEKNMHLLNAVKERALVIAVDTAVKPLLANDIVPHVVVTGDPQEANARHLKGVDLPETYLIIEPQSPVAAVNGWTGPKFICTFHDNMMRWVDRVLGDRGRVLVWGSVAVMAYDVAVKLGADPIIFIGQDLSFPGGRTYTTGTVFEVEDKAEMTVEALKQQGTTLIDMVDIYGQPVKTNRQMFAYFNFLRNRFEDGEVAERTIINATEGGILKSPRVTVLPLAEVMARYMTERRNVARVLDGAHARGNGVAYPNLLIELDTLIAALRSTLESCAKGVAAVRQTLAALEADDNSVAAKSEVTRQYNRMVALRKRVFRHHEAAKMIEMANQSGIFSFAQGSKAVRAEDGQYDHEFLRRSCYHYHTLYVSTQGAVERLIPLFEAAREAARARTAGVAVGT